MSTVVQTGDQEQCAQMAVHGPGWTSVLDTVFKSMQKEGLSEKKAAALAEECMVRVYDAADTAAAGLPTASKGEASATPKGKTTTTPKGKATATSKGKATATPKGKATATPKDKAAWHPTVVCDTSDGDSGEDNYEPVATPTKGGAMLPVGGVRIITPTKVFSTKTPGSKKDTQGKRKVEAVLTDPRAKKARGGQ